jgi:hypothetical protein
MQNPRNPARTQKIPTYFSTRQPENGREKAGNSDMRRPETKAKSPTIAKLTAQESSPAVASEYNRNGPFQA